MAAPISPYRSLPVERRVELVTYELTHHRESRASFIQRLCARGGGFRPATFQNWPAPKLAAEVVRLKVENAQDEFGLLQTLFVDMAPEIQAAFLDAAGVKHENGKLDEALEPPFAAASAVVPAAAALEASHGEDGRRYLRTIHRYASDAWPGLDEVIARIGLAPSA
jgi:hypothetical protein